MNKKGCIKTTVKIYMLMQRGLTVRQIAETIGVSERVVYYQLNKIIEAQRELP